MKIFKEITAFFGWLSGSLAGIAALFYACGYLITRAHLNMLGISALFSFSQEQYMQEGAKFMAELIDLMARIALPLLMVTILAAALLFLLRRTVLRRQFETAKISVAAVAQRRPWLWRPIAYGILLLLLALFIDRELVMFSAPLAISDLLFTPSTALPGAAGRIREWLVAGDRDSLDNLYFNLTLGVMKGGALLLLTWKTVEVWRLRMLLAGPFALTFLLSVLLLPMAYGVLKKPAKFPRISVKSDAKILATVRGDLLLLDKGKDDFVLWDATGRRLLWLPRGKVDAAEVDRARFLFGAEQQKQEVTP